MPAFAVSRIGKFALSILAISGTSLLVANIISPSLTKTPLLTVNKLNSSENWIDYADQSIIEDEISDDNDFLVSSDAEIKQIPPVIHKKFKVVLTSKDENYKVLTSNNSQKNGIKRFRTWYLFDKSKNFLERIDGLTTVNDISKSPHENTDINQLLKSKRWQGYRGQPSWANRGKVMAGSPFELKYLSGASGDLVKFPFLDYLKFFCKNGKQQVAGKEFLNSKCSRFDISFAHFRISSIVNQNWQKSFSPEKDICLEREPEKDTEGKWKFNNWKEKETCDLKPNKK